MYGECDFFTLKGVVEDMLDSLGLGGRSEYTPTGEHPFLHPGRAADVTIDGEKSPTSDKSIQKLWITIT